MNGRGADSSEPSQRGKPQQRGVSIMAVGKRPALLGREAVLLILALWLLQLLLITASQNLDGETPGIANFVRRTGVAAAGCGLFYVMGMALVSIQQGGVALRVALALPLAAIATAVHVIINNLVFLYTSSDPLAQQIRPFDPVSIFVSGTYWLWGYLSWAIIVIALAYSRELGDRDRRIVEVEALARRAQLRALRYQVNPHFLFNALNATAALVTARENDRAEEMLANLADFLRASLETDPLEDIPLAAELDYARLYLDIEQVRFSDRLRVEVDLPVDLRDALVPSLILQPLFENAVKHAVSPATRLVTIRASARRSGDRLEIAVADDGTGRGTPTMGMGVGLANIAQRLAARFGDEGSLMPSLAAGGGYVATVRLPLRFAAAELAA